MNQLKKIFVNNDSSLVTVSAGNPIADPQAKWEYGTSEDLINQKFAVKEAEIDEKIEEQDEAISGYDQRINLLQNDMIELGDKAYDASTYSGLGRKLLKKNIVNGVNTLTQSMVNDANTIYVIQYDYVLEENITIPTNCVLEFDGGSLIGNNFELFCDNLLNKNIIVEDFGVKTTNTATENSNNIKILRNLAYGRNIIFGPGIYRFNKPIEFHDGHLTIIGAGSCSGGSSPAVGVAVHSGTSLIADSDFTGGDYFLDLTPSVRNYNWRVVLRDFEVYCSNKCGGIRTEVFDQSIISNIVIHNHTYDKPGLFVNGSHVPEVTDGFTISENSIFENIYVYGYDLDHEPKRTAPNILLQGLEQCTLMNLVSGAVFQDDVETGILYCYECRGCHFIACGLGSVGNKATTIWLDSCYGITFDTTTLEEGTIPLRILSSFYEIFPASGYSITPVEAGSVVTQSNGFTSNVHSASASGIYLCMSKGMFDKNLPLMCGNIVVIPANGAREDKVKPIKTTNIWFTNTRIFCGNTNTAIESVSEIHDLQHGYFDFFAKGDANAPHYFKFHIYDTCDDVLLKVNNINLVTNDSLSCKVSTKKFVSLNTQNILLSNYSSVYDELELNTDNLYTDNFELEGIDLGGYIHGKNTVLKRQRNGKFSIDSCSGYLISNDNLIARSNNLKKVEDTIIVVPYFYKYLVATNSNAMLNFQRTSIRETYNEFYIYAKTSCKYYFNSDTALIVNNTTYHGTGGYKNISAGTLIRCNEIPDVGFVFEVICGSIDLPTV